jgi:CheY-like chemotaxis protein
MTTNRKDIKFLLVDDDDVDRMTIKRAFKKLRIANDLIIARDGIEALEILRGTHDSEEKVTHPFMILLDLNMPRMGGLEFLSEIRADPELSDSIVFVLTTSNDDKDRDEAYKKNVAGFIVKCQAEDQFLDALKVIDHYWRVIEFPS